ncbi:MAG TPA: tetratricopeptide repeat protein, partial [Gaiellales bacterium]|nr:tetratricopeptide repeat protein [Gaiellales bacterium]
RTPDGTRFRMLETLREYGAERLAEQGLITAGRTAHARWFATLVRAQDERLRGPQQLDALRVLDTERDDVLAALRFLGDDGDAVGAVDLAVHLGWYWLLRESGQDATRWTSFALAVPGAHEAPGGVMAEALQTVLGFAIGTETADIREAQQELVTLAGRLEFDRHPGAKVLRPLLLFMGEQREAANAALQRVLGDPDPWVRAAGRLAQLAYAENDGDVDLMRRYGDDAVVEWERLGDRWGLAAMLTSRGQVRTLDGDLAGAKADFERARECIRQLGGNSSDDVMVTMRLAELRLRDGDAAGAREYLEVMRAQRTFGAGEPLQQIFIAAIEGGIAVTEKDDAAVARAYEDLRDLLCTLGTPSLMTAHSGAVGHAIASGLALKLGRLDETEKHVREGYTQAVLTNDKPIIASVGAAVAAWAQARGQAREAAVVLGASTRLRGSDDATSPNVIELVAALREDLGEEYEVAYAEGQALDSDAATARVDPEVVQAVAAS